MLPAFMNLWLLALAALGAATASTAVPVDGDQPASIAIAVGSADDESGPIVYQTLAEVDENQPTTGTRCVRVVKLAGENESKVWIGVRLTPVPAPLAAHIGEQGVMISNVMKDSPADAAGLAQYDVVVQFGATEIESPADLMSAVGQTLPDQPVALRIIRKAAPLAVTITPITRPTEMKWEMKYEEPEDSFVDAAVKLHGKALQLGPQGKWIMRDLGQLRDLPEMLKELKDLDVGIDLDKLHQGLDVFGKDMDVKILRNLDGGCLWMSKDGSDNAQVQIRIQVADDGTTTTIQRMPDGKFEVSKTDADGNESSATYESEEEFEATDPAAYELYSRHAAGDGVSVIKVQPLGSRALKWRHDFQVDVKKHIEDALERAKAYSADAQEQCHEALQKANEAVRKARTVCIRKQSGPTDGSQSLMVLVDDDGSVEVTVTENGQTTKYEFKSMDEFKRQQPELYDRVHSKTE